MKMQKIHKGYRGNPEYLPHGMAEVVEDDDFEMNDEWHDEEFDENVSHASSRANNTIVDSKRATNIQNQLGKNPVDKESPRKSSSKKQTNFNYRVVSHNNEFEQEHQYDQDQEYEGNQEAYEEGDYLVVGQEVIIEEQSDHDQNDPEKHRDFNGAYSKLVEKIYQEQGNNLLFSQQEYEEILRKQQRQNRGKTHERAKEFHDNKRKKIELIKQEKEMKEMDACTFKPQLVSRQLDQRRNFDEFLEAQRKHEEEKNLKRNILLEQESQMESGVVHHPEINEASRKMLANKRDVNKPVHERLYGLSKGTKINQIINDENYEARNNLPVQRQASAKVKVSRADQETFAPVINQRSKEIVRDQPVQELLYNDALRRKDMTELRKQQNTIKEKSKRSRELNETNIEYLIHKFNKEFEPAFEAVSSQGEEGASEILNYRQLGELLFDMGFLSGSASSESEERILLSSMWTGLGGAQSDGLNKEVIRAFLLAVEGVKITDSVKSPSEEEFGQMKDGDFYPDCPKISKLFKLMYLNRIRHAGDRGKKRKVEADVAQTCTFQPILTENTQSLAQKYRQKIADNCEGGKITVLDILTAQTNKEQWIEETKKEIAKKEAQECTFRPMINESIPVRQDETLQSTGDKCFDLYQLAAVKPKNRVDKTKEEYEVAKYGNE